MSGKQQQAGRVQQVEPDGGVQGLLLLEGGPHLQLEGLFRRR